MDISVSNTLKKKDFAIDFSVIAPQAYSNLQFDTERYIPERPAVICNTL